MKFVYTYFIKFVCRYHGSKHVKESSKHITSIELDQKLYYLVRLDIKSVENTDAGEYKVVAKNSHGEGYATVNLNFEDGGQPK